jgi:hypothetical protein
MQRLIYDLAPSLLSPIQLNQTLDQQRKKKMKNRFSKLLAVAMTAAAFAGTAYATPIGTLTLSDNAGNTSGAIVTTGAGAISYDGTIGAWTFNITSGSENGSSTDPALILSSMNANFSGSTIGNVLTIEFTMSDVGPLAGTFNNNATALVNGVAVTFDVLLDGSPISVPIGASSGSTAGATSIGIRATLTASDGSGLARISDILVDPPSVPDGGTTVLLLGGALTVMGLFRKKLNV